jgi:hypothetical protein
MIVYAVLAAGGLVLLVTGWGSPDAQVLVPLPAA